LHFYFYHADLAFELAQVGHIAEAEAACSIALASPFAQAYPEWSDTRDEIAAKRQSASPSVVAINRKPEASLSQQAKTEQRPEPVCALALCWPPRKKGFVQTSLILIVSTEAIRIVVIPTSILDRVRLSIAARAPPALSLEYPQ
jgi:hypothetical protein